MHSGSQAHKTHPDRGGNADTFRLVKTAYDTLTDPKLRPNMNAFTKPMLSGAV